MLSNLKSPLANDAMFTFRYFNDKNFLWIIANLLYEVNSVSYWKVTLESAESGPSDDVIVDFLSIDSLYGDKSGLIVSADFMWKLVELLRTRENYMSMPNVKSVISPKNEDLTNESICVLFGLLQPEKDVVEVAWLIKERESENNEFDLLGFCPDYIAQQSISSPDDMNTFLGSVVGHPEDWKRFYFLFPIHLINHYTERELYTK